MKKFAKYFDSIYASSALIGQGLGYSKLYVYHIFALLSLVKTVKNIFRIGIRKFLFPIIFILWPLVTLLWSPDRSFGIIEFFQLAVGCYFLFSELDLKSFNRAIICVLAANFIISIGESFELFRYPYSVYSQYAPLLGRSSHNWSFDNNDSPTGFFWNPNNNAFFILIFTPLVWPLLKKYWKWVYYVIASFVIYKASSKFVLVAWVLITFLYLIQYVFKSNRFRWILGIILGGVLIFFSFNFMSNNKKLSPRWFKYSKITHAITEFPLLTYNIIKSEIKHEPITFNYYDIDRSLHHRLVFFQGITRVILDNFWFGVGAGGLKGIYNEHGESKQELTSPHFYALEVWAKYGVFYFLTYFSWVIYLIVKLWNRYRYCSYSLLLLFIFNPIISSISYFIPKWVAYKYAFDRLNECDAAIEL